MNNLNSSPKFFKVPTGLVWATLPLIVDASGARWLYLGVISHDLGLSLANYTLPKTDKPSWGRRRVDGHECIPVDRCPQFFASIKEGAVPALTRPFLFWARQHAFRAMSTFTIPASVVPMLEVDPEPTPAPVVATPKIETGLQTFNFGSSLIRTAMVDGEPFWVAKDVAEALGYAWKGTSGSISHVPEEWRGVCSVQTPSGIQDMAVLSEQGLYFFLGRSDKPAALPMQKWVAGEVLPSIRKTGSYGVQQFKVPQTLREALQLALDQQVTIEAHQATIADLKPQAAGLGLIATMTNDCARTLTDAAKILQQAPRKFTIYLQAEGWIYRQNGRWMAYQTKITQGLMEHKFCNIQHDNGTEFDVAQPLITPKGIAKLAVMLCVPVAA